MRHNRAFSLIELVIVVVIVGIIAAIAIPRLSLGAEGAAEAALRGDLAVMRNAIDLYVTEHVGDYPSYGSFQFQMTMFSNTTGGTAASPGGAYIYGPYLRAIPPLPWGDNRGATAIKMPPPDGLGPYGWVYDETTGHITANVDPGEVDSSGAALINY